MYRAPLFLDLNSCTGFAFWKPGQERPRAGSWDYNSANDVGGVAAMTVGLEADLMAYQALVQADVWYFEAPYIATYSGRPNGKVVEVTYGMVAVLRHIARREQIPCEGIERGKVTAHFTGTATGKSQEIKGRIIVHCEAKGWKVRKPDGTPDIDKADALAGLDYVVHEDTELRVLCPWDCQPAPRPGDKNAPGLFRPKAAG